MDIILHDGDLPSTVDLGQSVAIDTETLGLKLRRDRLCLMQLSSGDGLAHLVQFKKGDYKAPNLKKLLKDENVQKLFHYARFDVAVIKAYLEVECPNIYCTRTVSKLVRTYTDRHGLRDNCRELLGVELNKQQQSSYWGKDTLTKEQMEYAANDVLYLHALKEKMDDMLEREGRHHIAQACFDFIPTRAELDLMGWGSTDIFEH